MALAGRKEERRMGKSGRGRSRRTARGRWTASARRAAWRSPDMPRWFPLSGSSVVHFYQAGDSQAEERFELNTKAGAEERRGAEGSSKVEEDDDENLL